MPQIDREVEEARSQIDAALRRLPQDSFAHMQAAISVLFSTAGALAKTLPPELQRHWAGYVYEIADDLGGARDENADNG